MVNLPGKFSDRVLVCGASEAVHVDICGDGCQEILVSHIFCMKRNHLINYLKVETIIRNILLYLDGSRGIFMQVIVDWKSSIHSKCGDITLLF